ncbi:MAG TPA: membrane protein insertion efficiency factor YidD [bacterium]|nr:membrane protein insertion efficiency factor YidD [bacterium]HPR86500.1 membrane protein insertion efficiency factor YidD [bacterium]
MNNNPVKPILLSLIRFYQHAISPALPPSCRFQPTCSEYALQAIEKYGIIKGCSKAFIRLLKCNPLFPGGYDPV